MRPIERIPYNKAEKNINLAFPIQLVPIPCSDGGGGREKLPQLFFMYMVTNYFLFTFL